MSSIREDIVAAATLALNTSRPAGVPLFIRTRIDSPTVAQLPVATIYQAVENVQSMREPREGRTARGPIVRRSMLLKVEILTSASEGTQPDKNADPILVWAVKAMASAGTFGGLANNRADEIETKFEYEQGEVSFCRSTLTFEILYQSNVTNPESVA